MTPQYMVVNTVPRVPRGELAQEEAKPLPWLSAIFNAPLSKQASLPSQSQKTSAATIPSHHLSFLGKVGGYSGKTSMFRR